MKKLALIVFAAAFLAVFAVTPASACQMSGKGGMTKEQCALNNMDCAKEKAKEEKTGTKEKGDTKELPQKTKKEVKT